MNVYYVVFDYDGNDAIVLHVNYIMQLLVVCLGSQLANLNCK
jgi:hypothetical protein